MAGHRGRIHPGRAAWHKNYFTSAIGEVVFAKLLHRQTKGAKEPDRPGRLTTRERELVQMLCEGLSNKAAAAKLGISVKTIETHRRQLMEKLNIYSVAELTRYAVRGGLVAP